MSALFVTLLMKTKQTPRKLLKKDELVSTAPGFADSVMDVIKWWGYNEKSNLRNVVINIMVSVDVWVFRKTSEF